MIAKLEWHADESIKRIEQIMYTRLVRATVYLHGRGREKLSVSGTGIVQHGQTLRSGWRLRKGQRIYGVTRSKPGEPPRKQTGKLRTGANYSVDRQSLEGRVGVQGPSLVYAKVLEIGNSRIKQRPYLRKTLEEESGHIVRILAGTVT